MERGQPALSGAATAHRAATTVHFVRHAAHGLLGQVLAGRMPGVGLSEEGRAQAARLAAHFAGLDLAAVLCSPVQRAQETAAALGRPVTTEPGLDEIDFGAWMGRRFDALAGDPAWDRWNACRSLATPPGGETMLAAQARAVGAVTRAVDRFAGGTVVMVSHQDVLKAILAHLLGLSLDRLDRFELDPASCSTATFFPAGGARVDGINRPA